MSIWCIACPRNFALLSIMFLRCRNRRNLECSRKAGTAERVYPGLRPPGRSKALCSILYRLAINSQENFKIVKCRSPHEVRAPFVQGALTSCGLLHRSTLQVPRYLRLCHRNGGDVTVAVYPYVRTRLWRECRQFELVAGEDRTFRLHI